MSDASHIEWTDATWQPITGCTILSPGCINCYAMTLAAGRLRNHPSRKGLTKPSKAGPVWTGEVRFNEQWLDQPLHWTKPRMIFVCAHGDLFHESVPDEWIDRVFAVMQHARWHTFQVLTKRADRMRAYMERVWAARKDNCAPAIEGWANGHRYVLGPVKFHDEPTWFGWPPPNVWLGVSAERQQEADERIPLLLQTPAAVRFVSAEPLLGPIDLNGWRAPDCDIPQAVANAYAASAGGNQLDWIIVGGESGKNARPMHPGWARSLREQCKAADVKFFFKQWGEWRPTVEDDAAHYDKEIDLGPEVEGFRPYMTRVGKAKAGRLLDGKEHNEFPSHGVAA